ncbi:MAG: UDP-glucose--hexose-1-phosphate uridylyltransferase [Halanaerobium sp.]
MELAKVNQLIEKLLVYGEENNLLGEWDAVQARNEIRDILQITAAPAEEFKTYTEAEIPEEPQPILADLLCYAVENEIINDNITEKDRLDTEIMGALTPRQSEITERFYTTANNIGIKAAADQYYEFAQKINYIRKSRIDRNLNWKSETDYGRMEITINLAKPEKDPKEIAAAKEEPQNDYPKCSLCLENIGYHGGPGQAPRQNHRVVPLKLQNEDWFLQYSPYVYYNEHCIVFHREHIPMYIDKQTFAILMDFVDQIPHYFIGSNADLPLVGGSILSHDHFQGGRHIFPMEEANSTDYYEHSNFPDVKISKLKWPMTVIRLKAEIKEDLINLADKILENWREYSDPGLNILAFSAETGRKKAHNTITPIARKKNEHYELDLVLRNNRSSEEHPAGIFHPHKELHHIKKENIGLIEVMGRAILPGRLKNELNTAADYLSSNLTFEELAKKDGMKKHLDWINMIRKKHGKDLNREKAERILEAETAEKFARVLEDAGVYKNTETGQNGFERFLESTGIKNIES